MKRRIVLHLPARRVVVNDSRSRHVTVDDFSEVNIRRVPAGTEAGGEFASKGGSGGGSSSSGPVDEKINPPTSQDDIERFMKDVHASKRYREVDEGLEKLKSETRSRDVTMWSKEKNTDQSGEYTPERLALHKAIVAKTLPEDTKAAPGTRPHAVILIGAPGSGKTSAGSAVVPSLIGKEKLAVINADDVKEQLPEYKGWNAAAVHQESADIVEKEMVPQALAGGHNMLLDITGNNTDKMGKIVAALGARGYDVSLVSVSAPTHATAGRVWNRFLSQGRFVPPEYSVAVDGNPDRTYAALKQNKFVKHWAQVDTSGPETRVVERGTR